MKNQGISLISLIITIIVIIILAAIVIFTGLGTPDSANLAAFTQQCDNVYSAVMNRYGELYAYHSLNNEPRTQEQIYIEVAQGKDIAASGEASNVTRVKTMATAGSGDNYTNINPTAAKGTGRFNLGMTLPQVNHSDAEWFVTSTGEVFNSNGYAYDNKVYFNGHTYAEGAGQTRTPALIATAIKNNTNIVPAS